MPLRQRIECCVTQVFRFALRLTGDGDLASDLTQEACLRCWNHPGQFNDIKAMRVWLFRVVVNLRHDNLRLSQRRKGQEIQLVEETDRRTPSPEHTAVQRELLDAALEQLDELPARQRSVLYLHAVESLHTTEIADILSLSQNAVKASLSIARKRMRDWYEITHAVTDTHR